MEFLEPTLIKSFLSFIKTEFKSYIEERQEKLERKSYGIAVIDHLNNFSETLNPDTIYSIKEIKEQFSKYVLEKTGIELHTKTRDAHITLSIVNERNRGHYNVQKYDDKRKNIFYYTDDTHRNIKLFNTKRDINITIYYKNECEIDSIQLKDTK